MEYYHAAFEIAKHIDNKYIEASALNSIGKVNVTLANYDVAMQSALSALAISRASGALEWQADSWEVISKVHESRKEHRKALEAYKKHIALRDSVLSKESKAEITRKEMQFKLDRQETKANAEIKRKEIIGRIIK